MYIKRELNETELRKYQQPKSVYVVLVSKLQLTAEQFASGGGVFLSLPLFILQV